MKIMHTETLRTMGWILKAGGQVNPLLLAWWRFNYKGGDREARRRLLTFLDRRWMTRHGSPRYSIYTLNHEGLAMAQAAGCTTQCAVSRTPRPQWAHDATTAAVLARAKDLGVITDWWSPGDFSLTKKAADDHRKAPDAIAEVVAGDKRLLIAIETEASKKGGMRKPGQSNWARTAEEVMTRLQPKEHDAPLEVLIDGDVRVVRRTAFIALNLLLAKGMNQKLHEAGVPPGDAWWLSGDRRALRFTKEVLPVNMDLLDIGKPEIDPDLADV